ncbi:hypothetical protein HanXRQr2_Chr05g0236481 [Helianthus annuus]|uniref:Uncharacterized protein n=1 Tax=Helianthus annuus TaxID=4232 RepID=A0A9K3J312_HELAN|nr:hypothetical protein HanXRQr2_Chr05g0236481 [Helianthus annuus]
MVTQHLSKPSLLQNIIPFVLEIGMSLGILDLETCCLEEQEWSWVDWRDSCDYLLLLHIGF